MESQAAHLLETPRNSQLTRGPTERVQNFPNASQLHFKINTNSNKYKIHTHLQLHQSGPAENEKDKNR